MCIDLSVTTCRWHASVGDSLDSIASVFGTNYVQVCAHPVLSHGTSSRCEKNVCVCVCV